MKRNLFFAAFLLAVACSFSACEALTGGCKVCQNVTYENGKVVSASAETQYCGTDLATKESTPDVTIGSLTTKVECR